MYVGGLQTILQNRHVPSFLKVGKGGQIHPKNLWARKNKATSQNPENPNP